MRDKDQVFIFNQEELSLIKNTFADNDTLLYTVRKVLLQFPLTDAEKNLIKMSVTPEVLRVLKKRILPEIGDEFPLGQLPSILTTLGESLKVKSVEEMAPLIEAKALEIEYLRQRFASLEAITTGYVGDVVPEFSLASFAKIDISNPTKSYIQLQAYLFLLGYIDPMLGFIKSIAGTKEETAEQQKKRLVRDSSK